MERPVDAITSSVLKLQRAQREVDACVQEIIDQVSSDPFAASSLPDIRLKLSECRSAVDEAVDALLIAIERMGENPAEGAP